MVIKKKDKTTHLEGIQLLFIILEKTRRTIINNSREITVRSHIVMLMIFNFIFSKLPTTAHPNQDSHIVD